MSTRTHLLRLTRAEGFDPEWPDWDYEIECVTPDLCDGWEECYEDHGEVNEPDDYDDEMEFHGVWHAWRWGYGWTRPFRGCVVAASDSVCDSAHYIGLNHGSGLYEVEDDWDETTCYLAVIRRVTEHHRPETQAASAMHAAYDRRRRARRRNRG